MTATDRSFIASVMLALLAGMLTGALPAGAEAQKFSGVASHYGKGYTGKTASGVRYDPTKLTAAHRTLPFGTRVVVVNRVNNRRVTVVINDRGPFIKGRVIDLSLAAARELRMVERGLVQVTATVD